MTAPPRVLAGLLLAAAVCVEPVSSQNAPSQVLQLVPCYNAAVGTTTLLVNYATSNGRKATGVSFALRYPAADYDFVSQKSSLPQNTCGVQQAQQADGEVAFSCASFSGHHVVPRYTSGILKVVLRPKTALPSTHFWIEPNTAITIAGFKYVVPAASSVKACAGTTTRAPLDMLRHDTPSFSAKVAAKMATTTQAPATTPRSDAATARGGNDSAASEDDADEPTSQWQALASEEQRLVQELAERQRLLVAAQAKVAEDSANQAAKDEVTKHQTAAHDATVKHRAVLRNMNVSEKTIVEIQSKLQQSLTKELPELKSTLEKQLPDQLQAGWDSEENAQGDAKHDCGPPSIPGNGYRQAWSSNDVGAQVRFVCNYGFYLVGSPNRTCLANLEWSGTPTFCEPFTRPPTPSPTASPTVHVTPPPTPPTLCPLPHSLAGEKVQISFNTRRVGGTVHFNCDDPYMLIGPSEARCTRSGHWTVFPSCVKEIHTCSHLRCKIVYRPSALSDGAPMPALRVFYHHAEFRGSKHHCQHRVGSTDPADCSCWCWNVPNDAATTSATR